LSKHDNLNKAGFPSLRTQCTQRNATVFYVEHTQNIRCVTQRNKTQRTQRNATQRNASAMLCVCYTQGIRNGRFYTQCMRNASNATLRNVTHATQQPHSAYRYASNTQTQTTQLDAKPKTQQTHQIEPNPIFYTINATLSQWERCVALRCVGCVRVYQDVFQLSLRIELCCVALRTLRAY